jgi:hypothetical protein
VVSSLRHRKRSATSAELDDCQQPSKTTLLNQKLARVTREASHTQEDESETRTTKLLEKTTMLCMEMRGKAKTTMLATGSDGSEGIERC